MLIMDHVLIETPDIYMQSLYFHSYSYGNGLFLKLATPKGCISDLVSNLFVARLLWSFQFSILSACNYPQLDVNNLYSFY